MKQYMSLKDHVYDYISENINNGTLHPNDKINEVQISEVLNVSRTPVREALIQLASDGYLESLPRRGFRVMKVDEEKAKEIYGIIGPLDGRAAYCSVSKMTDENIQQMKFLSDSMEMAIENGLYTKYYELQLEFHDTYISRCGNNQLIALINQVKKNFMKKQYTAGDNDNLYEILKSTNEEHKKIVELFKEKDGEKLQSYIRDVHWNQDKAKFDIW